MGRTGHQSRLALGVKTPAKYLAAAAPRLAAGPSLVADAIDQILLARANIAQASAALSADPELSKQNYDEDPS